MTESIAVNGERERLSPSEKRFLLSRPHLVLRISHAAFVAEQETERRGYGDGDGLHNAFLRCYWSALLARDIGLEDARDFFEIHPARLGASPDEAQRDLRNSTIGLSIGRSHPGASNETLADRCAWALEFGRLQLAAPRRAALYSAVRQ